MKKYFTHSSLAHFNIALFCRHFLPIALQLTLLLPLLLCYHHYYHLLLLLTTTDYLFIYLIIK